jgi:hypothetical protein
MRQETGLFLPRSGMSIPKLLLLIEDDPAHAELFTYDRLHARKELEAVPVLIIGASLKGVEDAIKHRGLLAVEKLFDLDAFLSPIESLFASPSGKLRW